MDFILSSVYDIIVLDIMMPFIDGVYALKNISEGVNLEESLYIDNVLKYMAVHTFAVNMDSLSVSMAHNYYLYENNGKLNILLWDYNLSFGGMGMGGISGAEDVVNYPIDTPFSGTNFFDTLLENEEYRGIYHEYLRILCEEYVGSGNFEVFYNKTKLNIDELAKNDPNSLYSYEEYVVGSDMLCKTILLRAESIIGQLNGTVPPTSEEQKSNPDDLVDSSAIDTKVMGSMGGGMGGFGDRGEKPNENGGFPERSKNKG